MCTSNLFPTLRLRHYQKHTYIPSLVEHVWRFKSGYLSPPSQSHRILPSPKAKGEAVRTVRIEVSGTGDDRRADLTDPRTKNLPEKARPRGARRQ